MTREVGGLGGVFDLLEEVSERPTAALKAGHALHTPLHVVGEEFHFALFDFRDADLTSLLQRSLHFCCAIGLGGRAGPTSESLRIKQPWTSMSAELFGKPTAVFETPT